MTRTSDPAWVSAGDAQQELGAHKEASCGSPPLEVSEGGKVPGGLWHPQHPLGGLQGCSLSQGEHLQGLD